MSKLYIEKKYGQTPNELLNKKDVSLKAKGLFGYLQSKPDGWEFSKERIIKQTKDGISSVKSAFKELKEHGYLQTIPIKSSEGKFAGYNYILYENPEEKKPEGGKPYRRKTLPSGNHTSLSNKDISKKDIVRKKNSSFKKPYFRGMEMRQTKKDGKWWVLPESGAWLEFAGKEKDIIWK